MRDSFGDLLLYAFSARRDVSWSQFTSIFDELWKLAGTEAPDTVQFLRWKAARALQSLGHIDIDEVGERRLFAAPPVLALLPTPGTACAVLCGSRSPQTRIEIEAAAVARGVDIRVTPGIAASPAVIELVAASVASLREVAAAAGLLFSNTTPAWAIAAASISLSSYLAELRWDTGFRVNWVATEFDRKSLQFRSVTTTVKGPRLVRYVEPVRGIRRYRLFVEDRSAWIDPRWGRYAVCSSGGMVQFDERARAVRVPLRVPLPTLLARALTLCSGRSAVEESAETARYERVPRAVFDVVAGKLRTEELLA